VTRVVHSRVDLAEAIRAADQRAVVMTMGALHDGHASLMSAARRLVPHGQVVVTDFVNPTQFAPGEDFERYPRTLDDDVTVCTREGVDVVFAPDVDAVYGEGTQGIAVDPGPLGDILEGARRPGHFRGVLTVVAKLLNLTRPTVALFGEKDYQQLVLIRSMVASLDFPVDVVGVPTVREGDGLAMSSRNRYLSPEARGVSVAVPRALEAGRRAASDGADGVVAAASDILHAAGLTIDYVAVTDPALGAHPPAGAARLLLAVTVEGTRLIDNCALDFGAK
jgi:pantoate--beta-alanine ligase